MCNKVEGFFKDDGTPVNPELVPKPSLCITCRQDEDSSEEKLCILTRIDQQGEGNFKCEAYERIRTNGEEKDTT